MAEKEEGREPAKGASSLLILRAVPAYLSKECAEESRVLSLVNSVRILTLSPIL
jgi:hypothetical protein